MASFRSKESFIRFAAIFFVIAYVWVINNLCFAEQDGWVVCPFRRLTTLPCPGCGLTTAVLCFLKGQFTQALLIHPLVILALPILVVGPVVLALSPDRFYGWWLSLEQFLSVWKGKLVLLLVIGSVWGYLIYHSF